MTKKNNLGVFNSLDEVYAKYPEGGYEGAYLTIEGHEYYWDDHNRCWVVPGTSPETALDNLTVNRNLTVGGKAAIKTIKSLDGTVTVEDPMRFSKGVIGDLFVDGSLKARHVRQPNCGLFASVEQLKNIYPNPEVGMWATIGNTIPGDIWRCQVSGHWEPTGEKGGCEPLNLENYEHALFIAVPKTKIIETEHLEAIKAWVKKHPDNSGSIFVVNKAEEGNCNAYRVYDYHYDSIRNTLQLALYSFDAEISEVYWGEPSINLTTGEFTLPALSSYQLAQSSFIPQRDDFPVLCIEMMDNHNVAQKDLKPIKDWVDKHPNNSGVIFLRPVLAKRTYVVQMYDSTSTPGSLKMILLSYGAYDSVNNNNDKVFYNEGSLNLTTGVWTMSRQEQYRLARHDALESEVTRAKSEEEKLSKRIDNTYTKNETYSKSETYNKGEVDKKLSTVYKSKGSVQNANALLALTDVHVGDTYNVIEAGTMDGEPFIAGTNFVATKAGLGNQPKMWDPLGGTINTDELAKKDEVAKTYATKQELQKVNNEAVTLSKKFKNMDSLFVLSIPENNKLSQDVFNRLKSWAETNADQANQYEQRKINAPIIVLTVDPVTKDHRSAISSVLSMIDGQNFLQLVGPTLNADEEVATMFNIKISVNLSDAEAPVTVQQTRDFTLAAVDLVTQETDRAQRAEKDLQTHATNLEKQVENIKSKQTEDGKKLDNLDNDKLSYVNLQVGNSTEIKQANLAILKAQNGQFFVKINYAFGVGTFNTSTGGFISTTNAYDNDVYYTIAADGSITKKDDYIAPNEPYSIHLTQDKIGVQLTEIEGSKVSKAGELVIVGSTGMITYTRTSDSTASAVYFTDDNKDGSTTLLTYNSSNRTIQSTRISKEPEGGYLRPLFEANRFVKYIESTGKYRLYGNVEDGRDAMDVSTSQMTYIFEAGHHWYPGAYDNNTKIPTILMDTIPQQADIKKGINTQLLCRGCSALIKFYISKYGLRTNNIDRMFQYCESLEKITGFIYCHLLNDFNLSFNGCSKLSYVHLKSVIASVSFKDSPLLSVEDYTDAITDDEMSSLGYLIKYAENSGPITVTLHHIAFDKVPETLKQKATTKNISIAKAL